MKENIQFFHFFAGLLLAWGPTETGNPSKKSIGEKLMRLRRSLRLFLGWALLPALFALTALSSAQAIAAGWSNPATLGTTSQYVTYTNDGAVAMNSGGKSVAVWRDNATQTVKYAIQQGGVWSAMTGIPGSGGFTVSEPGVVIDDAGAITVIWGSNTRTMKYCVSGGRVVRCYVWTGVTYAATLSDGATVWSVVNLSAPGTQVADTEIGLDQNGNAVALWTYVASTGAPKALQSATKPAGGAWSSPQTLYGSINPISLPSLAVGATGAAVAVWQEKMPGVANPVIRATYKPAAGNIWGSVEDIAQPAGCSALRAAIDGSGQAAAAWNNNYAVEWARRSNGTWVSEPLVSAPGRMYSGAGPYAVYAGPDLVAGSQGNFLIGWLEHDVSSGGLTAEAQLHQAAGVVASASWAAGGLQNAGIASPRTTIGPDGSGAMVAWVNDDEANAYSASFTPGQGWGQPHLLSNGATQYTAAWGMGVAMASGPNSAASAMWFSRSPNYGLKIRGSNYLP